MKKLRLISFLNYLEMFYLNSTLNFGIPPVLVFQLEVCYTVDRLVSGLTAQRKGTTAQWYSNKTSLPWWYDLWRGVKSFQILKNVMTTVGKAKGRAFDIFLVSNISSIILFYLITFITLFITINVLKRKVFLG